MYYVYILQSSKNKNWRYIGATEDLRKRFERHNTGYVKSTKAYKPFEILYYEAYQTLELARKREYQLKNHSQEKERLFRNLGLL